MTTTNPLAKAKDSGRSERTRGEDSIVAARMAAETIAAQQADIRRLEALCFKAEGHIMRLLVAAGAAYDYFTDKTDADLVDGSFRGNREAGLANELAEAIRRAKGERL